MIIRILEIYKLRIKFLDFYFEIQRFLARMISQYLFAHIIGISITASYILAIGVSILTNYFTSDLFV